jgi:hypothetical protein
MANVLLTTRCNLHCKYCFAQERLQDDRNRIMALDDVRKAIAFLKKSGHPIFRAMGGEPTLHPHFTEIIEMALREGMCVDVLSNATWPDAYNPFFRRISSRYLSFLLNIDRPANYAPRLWDRIQNNVAAVAAGGNVALSFNLFEAQPKYDYIFDLVRAHHINKIRLSLSLPVVGAKNAHLSLAEIKGMGPIIVEFARKAEELGASAYLDNAVPLCIFTREETGELLLKGVLDLKRNARCNPVIDIGPDLRIWCCFCLSNLWNRHLDEFENLDGIIDYYSRMMHPYQSRLYPMDECGPCPHREKWGCQGGCLSYTILKHGECRQEQPASDPLSASWNPDAILTLHPQAEFHVNDLPQPCCTIIRKDSSLQMNLPQSFAKILPLLNGGYQAQKVLDRLLDSLQERDIEGPVADFAKSAIREGSRELLLGMVRQGFAIERPGN